MSAVLPGSNAAHAVPSVRGARLPAWLREPLLHFVALGALLFAIDHVIVGRADDPRTIGTHPEIKRLPKSPLNADDPRTIVVGAEVDAEAKQVFKAARGREPDAAELAALRAVWLDNEVLYREGLALQVDKGDTAIRERVIFKALSVVDANVKLPPVDDKLLRAWFESRRRAGPPRCRCCEAVNRSAPAWPRRGFGRGRIACCLGRSIVCGIDRSID
ncbi:MAG: hypothetical protein V4750_09635, partial [Pseudomonadota bacterium]